MQQNHSKLKSEIKPPNFITEESIKEVLTDLFYGKAAEENKRDLKVYFIGTKEELNTIIHEAMKKLVEPPQD